jgi:hypothetical protein
VIFALRQAQLFLLRVNASCCVCNDK